MAYCRLSYGLSWVVALGLAHSALAQNAGNDRSGSVRRASSVQPDARQNAGNQQNGQSSGNQNAPGSNPDENSTTSQQQQQQIPDLLAGYYGGYGDGYLDGLEDAVYYMIELHHQGQDARVSPSSPRDEQLRLHRDALRDRMRQQQNPSGGGWSSANTRRLSGQVVDHWVARRGGQQHQFVELETSRGSRCDVDLGVRTELGNLQIRQNDRIAVRGQFRDTSSDTPMFVAQRVWANNAEVATANGGNTNAGQTNASQTNADQLHAGQASGNQETNARAAQPGHQQ